MPLNLIIVVAMCQKIQLSSYVLSKLQALGPYAKENWSRNHSISLHSNWSLIMGTLYKRPKGFYRHSDEVQSKRQRSNAPQIMETWTCSILLGQKWGSGAATIDTGQRNIDFSQRTRTRSTGSDSQKVTVISSTNINSNFTEISLNKCLKCFCPLCDMSETPFYWEFTDIRWKPQFKRLLYSKGITNTFSYLHDKKAPKTVTNEMTITKINDMIKFSDFPTWLSH